jgi:hypothetical protein
MSLVHLPFFYCQFIGGQDTSKTPDEWRLLVDLLANPNSPPRNGMVRKGGEKGSWYDENTREYIRPESRSDCGGHDPHVDYRDAEGNRWWLFYDGTKELKPEK